MILKLIPLDLDKAGRKSKATNIADLTEYIAVPDGTARLTRLGYHIDQDGVIHGGDGEQPEKVLYLTSRGFNTRTFKGQQAEMVALSMECKKSKYPIQHWVASWPEDEQPTPEQVEELLDVFLEQLGLEKHQVVAALHRDTDNIHLHIAINKVNPETYLVVKPAKGWWKEAAQRTVAIIEHRQGWRPERRARYTVMDDGTVARVGKLDGVPTVPTRAGDMENRTGQKSAARIAIEEAGELIRSASSWAELHQGLAERGMRYERAGGVGAHIYVGDQPVKASTAGHWCSFTIKTAITGVRVVSNGLGVTKLAGVDMHGIVSDIWDWALQVPVPIIAKMAQYVGYLAYYFGVAIPSLPYTIFMITVVGWVLGVVQTVIAAPLWAIMHMRPSQTFVGSEAQGYLLLMALFVRPALAVIGLFAAFLVADPLVDYTAKAFFAMRGDVAASTGWPGVLAQFWQFFAWYATFGFLLGAVLTMVFGLPQMLPDKVLAWLNVGVHDLGATSATNEMRAAVSRQGHASGKAALERLADSQSRGGRGGARGQLPGDGPSGEPSGGRPRGGGGSTPVNAGAQGVAPPLDAAESAGTNGGQGISSRNLTATAQPSSGPSNAAPLNAGSSPPTQESAAPQRRLMDKISDGVGVAAGHAVLGAVDAAKSGGQRGGEAMRNSSGPVGGLVAGSIAAAAGAAEALARTAPMVGREGVAAFREGADARIAALKDTSPSPSDEAAQSADQPISAGEQRPNKED